MESFGVAPLMAGQMPVVVVSPLPPLTAVRHLSRNTRKVSTGRPGLDLFLPAMLVPVLPLCYCLSHSYIRPLPLGRLTLIFLWRIVIVFQSPGTYIHLFRSLLVAQSCRPGGRGWATARS